MSATPKLSPADLTALMCARVCHDLVSPISALGTALEVLDDPNNVDMHDDALDLVRMSARQASGKLQFLRLAFGAGGSAPGILSLEAIKTLVNGLYGDSKADIIWETQADSFQKIHARLLLNMMMLAVQAVPRGGTVRVNTSDATGQTITLTANGRRARLDPAIESTLRGKAPEDGFDGRTIQPFYTGMIVRELKGKISTHIEDETVTFTATMPEIAAQSAA